MKYWKFKLQGRRKAHLCIGEHDKGVGQFTLCGIHIDEAIGPAKPLVKLEGDECLTCADAMVDPGHFNRSSVVSQIHVTAAHNVSIRSASVGFPG